MSMIDKVKQRRDVYRSVFNTPNGKKVLEDLADFCKARESTFIPGDVYGSVYQEGIKTVFLHIMEVLNQSDEEINEIVYKTFNVRR